MLNSSTIDDLGEWCGMKEGGTTRQAESSALGIHDNLVSGNWQGRSHWKKHWKLSYLPHMFHAKLGDHISENLPEARNRMQNDLTPEAWLYSCNTPAHNHQPPHTPTQRENSGKLLFIIVSCLALITFSHI